MMLFGLVMFRYCEPVAFADDEALALEFPGITIGLLAMPLGPLTLRSLSFGLLGPELLGAAFTAAVVLCFVLMMLFGLWM